jgi:hypothetical protein
MPNHIHWIIQIVDNDNCGGVICGDAICRGAICGDAICRDAICGDAICRGAINRTPTVNDDEYHPMLLNGWFSWKYNPMFYNNIWRMVRWFKWRISFECRKINPGFKWQWNYWEHIIRNEKSYYRIAEYIINNPKKWEFDTLKN